MSQSTGHALLHPSFILRLAVEFREDVDVLDFRDFGDGLYQTLVASPHLKSGYNGQLEISVVDDRLRFKREHDT